MAKTKWIFRKGTSFDRWYKRMDPKAQEEAQAFFKEWQKNPFQEKYRIHPHIQLKARTRKNVLIGCNGRKKRWLFVKDGNVLTTYALDGHEIEQIQSLTV